MKTIFTLFLCLGSLTIFGSTPSLIERFRISETVYVESPTDSDSDGKPDRIYAEVDRPSSTAKLPTVFTISPYTLGGNDGPMHGVDVDLLPQDEKIIQGFSPEVQNLFSGIKKTLRDYRPAEFNASGYARVAAHSLGTGYSTGCPTVGDMSETLAAKAVIDWLNGRAKAFDKSGKEVKASWANGSVGMTGVSYNGTLPIMVATTGVEGLDAIVPIAAISNWYDYYRANGLVVNPGGYIGEDADVLAYFIMRAGSCKAELDRMTKTMGRENGDFTSFWQKRDHLANVKNIKAATFIIHGQSDWNVKQKHAIQLWEALDGVAPRRMFLHKGGHGSTSSHNVPAKLNAWFDHYLQGADNGIEKGPQVEVELPDGSLMTQEQWPHEDSKEERFYFAPNSLLASSAGSEEQLSITDFGRSQRLEILSENPSVKNPGRLAFLTAPLTQKTLLTGTTKVSLSFSVTNRRAANLTVAIIDYNKNGKSKIITRGWVDAQNHSDVTRGELLEPGKTYQITFDLEPKQYRVPAGSRIGVVIASTDYDYTLRPKEGTVIEFNLGSKSFIEMGLAADR